MATLTATADDARVAPQHSSAWLAALALLFAPFAFLYLGRPRRALGYIAALGAPFAVALLTLTWGWAGVARAALLLTLLVALYAMLDAWRCARASAGAQRTPTYAVILAGCAALAMLACTRGFFGEPYKIPSSSMAPLLQRGDLVLVSKWGFGNYGSDKMPVAGKIFRAPQRGSIMVFKWPSDPKVDYVKRVVGVPGDVIEYRNKQLAINGAPAQYAPLGNYQLSAKAAAQQRLSEKLAGTAHDILIDPNAPAISTHGVKSSAMQHCSYDMTGFRCTVPAAHYFVLGDNRDSSNDSRYWGMVPKANLVGLVVWHTQVFRDK